jgi:hypothetical protein
MKITRQQLQKIIEDTIAEDAEAGTIFGKKKKKFSIPAEPKDPGEGATRKLSSSPSPPDESPDTINVAKDPNASTIYAPRNRTQEVEPQNIISQEPEVAHADTIRPPEGSPIPKPEKQDLSNTITKIMQLTDKTRRFFFLGNEQTEQNLSNYYRYIRAIVGNPKNKLPLDKINSAIHEIKNSFQPLTKLFDMIQEAIPTVDPDYKLEEGLPSDVPPNDRLQNFTDFLDSLVSEHNPNSIIRRTRDFYQTADMDSLLSRAYDDPDLSDRLMSVFTATSDPDGIPNIENLRHAVLTSQLAAREMMNG